MSLSAFIRTATALVEHLADKADAAHQAAHHPCPDARRMFFREFEHCEDAQPALERAAIAAWAGMRNVEEIGCFSRETDGCPA